MITFIKNEYVSGTQITEEYELTLFGFIHITLHITRLNPMRYNEHVFDFITNKSWEELAEFRINRGL